MSLANLNQRNAPWKGNKHFALFKVLTLTCLHDASRDQVCLYLHLKKFKCFLYIQSNSFTSSPRIIMPVFSVLRSTTNELLCQKHTLPSLMIPSYHSSIHTALPWTILMSFKLSTMISPVTSIPAEVWNSYLLTLARAHKIDSSKTTKSQTYSNALPRHMQILYCYLLNLSNKSSVQSN